MRRIWSRASHFLFLLLTYLFWMRLPLLNLSIPGSEDDSIGQLGFRWRLPHSCRFTFCGRHESKRNYAEKYVQLKVVSFRIIFLWIFVPCLHCNCWASSWSDAHRHSILYMRADVIETTQQCLSTFLLLYIFNHSSFLPVIYLQLHVRTHLYTCVFIYVPFIKFFHLLPL